jgi:membrane protein YqaA with SNARE-associated domain
VDKLSSVLRRIQSFADRPWYLPLIAGLGGADAFLLVIPTDGLLVSFVLLRPKHWLRACLFFTLFCAVGCWLLAWVIQSGAEWLSLDFFYRSVGQDTWNWIDSFVDNHGELALGVLATLPIPQFPGVVVAALAEMPLWSLFVSILAGRLVKYFLLSYAASHAPRLLMRVPFLKKEISAFTGPPSVS